VVSLLPVTLLLRECTRAGDSFTANQGLSLRTGVAVQTGPTSLSTLDDRCPTKGLFHHVAAIVIRSDLASESMAGLPTPCAK
jgi:hypothetical protein